MRRRVALKLSYTILDSMPFPVFTGPDDAQVAALSPLVAELVLVGEPMRAFRKEMSALGLCRGEEHPGAEDPVWRRAAAAAVHAFSASHVYGLSDQDVRNLIEQSEPTWKAELRETGSSETPALIERYLADGRPMDLLAWTDRMVDLPL